MYVLSKPEEYIDIAKKFYHYNNYVGLKLFYRSGQAYVSAVYKKPLVSMNLYITPDTFELFVAGMSKEFSP
jgi:hypothetical protein